jgi:hypothetical protein
MRNVNLRYLFYLNCGVPVKVCRVCDVIHEVCSCGKKKAENRGAGRQNTLPLVEMAGMCSCTRGQYSVTASGFRYLQILLQIFFVAQQPPIGPRLPHYRSFTITLRQSTLSRTPLDDWSAPHRQLYLTTHNTHNRQTSMPPAGFEPAIPASERPQTYAFRPRGQRDRHFVICNVLNSKEKLTFEYSVVTKYIIYCEYIFFPTAHHGSGPPQSRGF